MAIEKTIEQDKFEIVGPYKAVQVREATVITEDSSELSRNFRRYVLHPDSDISTETAEIQAICNAVWTDDVKTSWTEFQAEQFA
mgnify:FL=1|tara:strand:+ start:3000 stop:3251 length:252 start_codon:yes stop_codon:yes gene_type:complete